MSDPELDLDIDQYSSMPEADGLLDVPLGPDLLRNKDFQRFGYRFSLSDLNLDFAVKVRETLGACQSRDITMVPYTGIRTPWEQAPLWRQSRSTATVNAAIDRLRTDGANFLADVLIAVGPQPTGPNVTNALPGFSWHQWGEAVDSYWQVSGGPEWDDLTGYKVYAEEGTRAGLTAGGYWTSLKDWPHLQFRTASNPGALYSVREIDQKMQELFGGTERRVQGVA